MEFNRSWQRDRRNSPFSIPEKEARNLAEALAYRAGRLALGDDGDPTPGKIVTRYRVEPYPGVWGGWGIVERWQYADRPDLPEFGGGFMRIEVIVLLAGAAPRCPACGRLLVPHDASQLIHAKGCPAGGASVEQSAAPI